MKIKNTHIPDVKVIEPKVFHDHRGYFFESFNLKELCVTIGRQINFVQDNQSCSHQGVLRGLHFQNPHPQIKLIHAIQGKIFDVAVDIRPYSATYKKWVGVELSAENKRQLWIPEGFAHGYQVLSPQAKVLYKVSDYWYPEFEFTLNWDDPAFMIDWPSRPPVLSAKDTSSMSKSPTSTTRLHP